MNHLLLLLLSQVKPSQATIQRRQQPKKRKLSRVATANNKENDLMAVLI